MRSANPQWRAIADLADTNPEALGAGADPRANFKYVDLSSVSAGSIAWNSAPEVTLLTAPSRARRVLRRSDVLFGTVRPNLQSHGYVDRTDNGALIGSTGFSVIRAKAGISDPRYLFHCIMSSGVTAQANRDAVGSSYPALNDGDVRRFEVFAPPLGEQAMIAEVLDILDTTIRQTEAIFEKLKQVKQGLLHDLLTRGIDANGELRPPQSQAPHLYKDSPLGWIPRAWDVCRLADYMAADITYGIVQAGPHVDGGVPYIRTGDMASDRLDAASLLRTSRRIANSYRRSEVRSGEIVMAIRATVGKVLPIPAELDGANLTQGTARLAPNGGTDAQFLLWALRHQRAQNSISVEIKGTTFAEITLAALREVPLAAPIDVHEQRRIGEQLMACEARISAEVRQKQKLVKQKSGLMDDLLTGRVRVTPLLDAATA